MDGARRAARLLTTLTVGVLVSYALGGGVAARGIDPASMPDPQACDPCPLSRVVVDTPAWDETVTVTDRAAWDETLTVVDAPATTAYRTVVDAPAHSVAHHDLVTPAYTVARAVLVTPAHEESYQLWVSSGYWTQHWIDTSHYLTQTSWVSSGYWSSYWVDTSHYETRPTWVSSGYTSTYWVDTSHYETQSYYVSSGYWSGYWVDTGGYWATGYQPGRCWGGPDGDCDDGYAYSYWQPTGYWASQWIDTSYWSSYSVWVASGYYASQWIDTSHWEYPMVWVSSGYAQAYWVDTSQWVTTQLWVASGYYEQHWVDTGGYWAIGYQPGRCWGGPDGDCDDGYSYGYWVATGYSSSDFWVDTSHYETRTRHVDDLFTTVYDAVPALYRDWTETIAAVTHQEAYTIPAVTHTTTVHHDALTHTEVVHHPAATHLEPITADQLTTQSRQSAAAGSSGTTGGSDGRASAPTTIAVVSNITVVDRPAGTATRTVVDRAAYEESRTVVDRAAYDDSYTRPVYDYACDDGPCVRYIDHYDTLSVHHEAVTHTETVHRDAVTHSVTVDVPAVTHEEILRYSATVGDSGSSGSGGDPLADFELIAGLMALAGAGRYASRADELKAAIAEMAGLGMPIPAVVEPILVDGSAQTMLQLEAAVAAADGSSAADGSITIDAGDANAGANPSDQPTNAQPHSDPPRQDPLGFLGFLPDTLKSTGDATKKSGALDLLGNVWSFVHDKPILAGASPDQVAGVLSFVNDAFFETPIGFTALLADSAGLDTGLTARVDERMKAENRPFWERGVVAQQELGKALQQIAEDPTADPLDRSLAQTTRVAELIAQFASGNELGAAAVDLARGARLAAELNALDATLPELAAVTGEGADAERLFSYMTRERYDKMMRINDGMFSPKSGTTFASDLEISDPEQAAQLLGLGDRPQVRVQWSADDAATFGESGSARPATWNETGEGPTINAGDYASGEQMDLARWGGVPEYTSPEVLDLNRASVTFLEEAPAIDVAVAEPAGAVAEAVSAAVDAVEPVTIDWSGALVE